MDPGGRYRFANVLLSGPCNLRCPLCIGRQLAQEAARSLPPNLDRFPLLGFDRFVAALREHRVVQVSVTGTNTEPLLYHHTASLVRAFRQQVAGVQLSLHTNGILALERLEDVHRYDRVTVSVPSLDRSTCRAMTGRAEPVDLPTLVECLRIPLKVSTLVTAENVHEIPALLTRFRELGVRRAVLRRCVGEHRRWPLLTDHQPVRWFGGNPVYDLHGLEVSIWDFSATALDCLNLYSDGRQEESYLLRQRRSPSAA